MAFWQVGDSTNKQNLRVSRHHPMSWITIVWSMNAAACLTLAGFYCVVWCKQRQNWVHLLFSSSAVAAATIAAFELAMMHAQTVGRYEALLRWYMCPCGCSLSRSWVSCDSISTPDDHGSRGVSAACGHWC